MKELKKSEFFTVLPILREKRNDLTFSYSVIHHIIPGRIFVDNNISPKTALIVTESGLYRIVGNEENECFNRQVGEFFLKNLTQSENRFTLCSSSSTWDRNIVSLIGDKILKSKRISFEYNTDKSNLNAGWREKIPEGFIIERINKDIIRRCEEFNEEYYIKFWGSVDNFISNGFGYCVLFKDKVVSACTSIYAGGEYAEIDIFTDKDFRGKGLGGLVSNIFIEHCTENNILPSWDCEINNLSSFKLAERLGFENKGEYTIYVRKNLNYKGF